MLVALCYRQRRSAIFVLGYGCEKYKYEKKTRNIVYIIKPGIVE
jgi:hypothetical protein